MPPSARIAAVVSLWAGAICLGLRTSSADEGAPGRFAPQLSQAQRAPADAPVSWPPAVPARQPRHQGVLPAAFESPLPAAPTAPKSPTTAASRASLPADPQGQAPSDGKTAPAQAGRAFHLPLPPPSASKRPGGSAAEKPQGGLASVLTVLSSLAVVLGLFFVLAWAMRRAAPKGSTILPGEVVEVLGRAPLAGRQQVHLLRCGAKLLLVCVTPAGAETLTEITDPDEVNRLAGLCRQAQPDSATATFRQVFGQLSRQGPVLGLLGGTRRAGVPPDVPGRADAAMEGHDA